jgi:tRNA A37 N6-isopentenylltransferase MiaA
MNKFDPLNPISSTIYAHEARKVIREILERNKTPVLEGGSPFYLTQIFNPNLSNYNDDQFAEARQVARKVIELDGNNFEKTLKRAEDIFKKMQVPSTEIAKIG